MNPGPDQASAAASVPGAGWYAVATAIFLTGFGPIVAYTVLPLGSPAGVHLGTRFRPDTTITVPLRAGERLAIHAGWADRVYIPKVTCRARTASGRPATVTRPNGMAGPVRNGYQWHAMRVIHADETGTYHLTCHNDSEEGVVLATANDPWLDEFVDGVTHEGSRLMIPPVLGFVVSAALAMGVGTKRALRAHS